MINVTWLHVAALGVLAVATGVGATAIHHRGFLAGQAEREAYYAPLLQAARDAKDAADARAFAAEEAALKINSDSEKDHALLAQALADRAADADRRIDAVLRERRAALAAAAHCESVPAIPAAADESTGSAASLDRDRRFSDRISDVGRRCEHDAAEVAEFQRWYEQQRAAAAVSQ